MIYIKSLRKKTYGKKSSKYKAYKKKSKKQALKKTTWMEMAKLKGGGQPNRCNKGFYMKDDSTGKCEETNGGKTITEEDCKKDGAVCYTNKGGNTGNCDEECLYKR